MVYGKAAHGMGCVLPWHVLHLGNDRMGSDSQSKADLTKACRRVMLSRPSSARMLHHLSCHTVLYEHACKPERNKLPYTYLLMRARLCHESCIGEC